MNQALALNVMFWVFIIFFTAIGVCSLVVAMGLVPRALPSFKRWAVPGFIAAVTSAAISAFAAMQLAPPSFFVTVTSPVGTPLQDLTSAAYSFDEAGKNGAVETHGGVAVLSLDNGLWRVKLPPSVLDKAIRLTLKAKDGSAYEVDPFYPNWSAREVKPSPQRASLSSAPWWPVGETVLLAAEAAPPIPRRRGVRFSNYARVSRSRSGVTIYQWRIFVDELPDVLATISQVDYVLDPSYAKPFRVSTDRDKQFELIESGSRGFAIVATIHHTNGTSSKASYTLDLEKNWPTK